MRSDFRYLRIVVAAADAGSFSAAAERLGVEVSAVSRAIRELEDSIGVSLFERLARGVRPTDAGRAYVESAKDILRRYNEADANARRAGSGLNGKLGVGFVWSFSTGPIVDLMREFRSANPSILVRTLERGDDDLIAELSAFELDVILTAIVQPLHPRWKVVERLNRQILWNEPLVVVVPDHVTTQAMSWAELAGHDILCRTEDDWRRFVSHVEQLSGATLTFLEQEVALDSLLGLVAADIGWCILPASSVRVDVAGIRTLPIVSNGAVLQIEAFWRPETDNPALTRFLALARRTFSRTDQG